MPTRLAVLASGRGSNLQAIIEHFENLARERVAKVVLVASNRPDSPALIRAATASTSVMMCRTTMPTSGSVAIRTSVARVSALIGLNATFPRILTHISVRIFCVTGQRIPALISDSEIAFDRSERVPSGSPSDSRFPSV